MTKKISLIILLILASATAQAVSFTIDPASIMDSWFRSNHWPGITAAALFTGMIAASWKMGKLENETQAKMISDLFKTGRYVAVLLLVIEFYSMIKGLWINILGAMFDIFDSIMGLF